MPPRDGPLVRLPCWCASCGAAFLTRDRIAFGSAKSLIFANSGETCPACGKMARIPDGAYELVGSVLRFASGSPGTQDRINELLAILERGYSGKAAPEKVEAEIAVIAPEIAAALRLARSKNARLLALAALYLSLQSCSIEIKVDVNRLVDQVRGGHSSEQKPFDQAQLDQPDNKVADGRGEPPGHGADIEDGPGGAEPQGDPEAPPILRI